MPRLSILKTRRRGVLTMELMLVLPVLLIVLLGLVELGTYLTATEAIQGAAMAGTREATLPGATLDRVRTAVVGALAGWSYAGQLGPNDVQFIDNSAADGTVTVIVSVDARKAAVNSLGFVPGLSLSGKRITAEFVMRKE
jgi:Flp pilus assembly protein TadG